jgi:vacuolar-type H+-ATPase subunit C/Vma6
MAANQSQQAVAAKIRARYGNFLTKKDYLTLAQSDTLSDMVSFFHARQPFCETFSKLPHLVQTGNIEALLHHQ